jgi:SWI/SNF-related matrix-associated actin-dependent regulator 1 of chromatin subfamily A
MINLNDIKSRSVKPLLESYTGINPYLIKLAQQIKTTKNINLTENQINYILNNYDKEPTFVNRVLKISSYLGEEFQKAHQLNFKPERMLVEFILAETDKTYHIYGKLTQKQKHSEMYWVPKTQLLDDPYFEPITIEVDFTKYNQILSKYGKKLFNHQEEGVKFLLSRRGCILADDMGLGKSITSIVAALESGAKKILIVTTASAKINWEREIKVFDDQTAIVEGKNWKESKFTIINYDILKNFHTLDVKKQKKGEEMDEVIIKRELVNGNFDLIIIDEAHSIKDKDSNRGRIMEELSSSLSDVRIWLLTGTPISNRPMDFFNLLKIIKSKLTENWLFFARRYCDAKKMYRTLKNGNKKQILITDGASNLEELADKTRNLVLRRLKKDVLDMPDKMVIPMYYRMTYAEQTEYNELWDNYVLKRNAIGKSSNVSQKDLIELILLRQFIANITINYTIEMVENAIEMGKKVIVFTTFTEELEKIQEHFGKLAVTHNGKMSAKEKQHSIDEFQQNKKIKVFIGNIQSAGVAITLTEASVVIFNSFSWVPGINEQAEDRAFRIGQKNDVTVYYQLFEDTISNRMWETLNKKKQIISTIIGDKTPISDDEINFIIANSLE